MIVAWTPQRGRSLRADRDAFVRRALLVGFAFAAVSCARPASGVMIVVHSDLPVAELAQVRMELRLGGAAGTEFHNAPHPRAPSPSDGDDVVGTQAVTAPEPFRSQRLWVRVTPSPSGTFSQDALVTFVEGRVLRLDLYLTDACRTRTTPCPEGSACGRDGACVSLVSLPTYGVGGIDASALPDDRDTNLDSSGADVIRTDDSSCATDTARQCTPGMTQACSGCGSRTCTTACQWPVGCPGCSGVGACTPISVCGSSCAASHHVTSAAFSSGCPGACCGNNQVTCAPNCGAAFFSCGVTCPSGYAPASTAFSSACPGSVGSPNSTTCMLM